MLNLIKTRFLIYFTYSSSVITYYCKAPGLAFQTAPYWKCRVYLDRELNLR